MFKLEESSKGDQNSIFLKYNNAVANFETDWDQIQNCILEMKSFFHNQFNLATRRLPEPGRNISQQEFLELTDYINEQILEPQKYVFALIKNASQFTKSKIQKPVPETLNMETEARIIQCIMTYIKNEDLKAHFLENRDNLQGMPNSLIKQQKKLNFQIGDVQTMNLYSFSTYKICDSNYRQLVGRAALFNDAFIEDGMYQNGSLIQGTRLYYFSKDNIVTETGPSIKKSYLDKQTDTVAMAEIDLFHMVCQMQPQIKLQCECGNPSCVNYRHRH